jgi:hypothetical protein
MLQAVSSCRRACLFHDTDIVKQDQGQTSRFPISSHDSRHLLRQLATPFTAAQNTLHANSSSSPHTTMNNTSPHTPSHSTSLDTTTHNTSPHTPIHNTSTRTSSHITAQPIPFSFGLLRSLWQAWSSGVLI